MRNLLALAAFALLLGGCVTQGTTTETRPVTDTGGADGRRRSEVHTALAGEYYSRGNFPVALAETRAALKADSTYFQAHNMQGLVFMELREEGPAREAFERALSLSPDNPEVLNNYGWFLCLTSEQERGLRMMQRAAGDTLYSSPEKALLSAGLCLRRMGRNQEAEEHLRRAVLIQPHLIGALYQLATITFERGAMREAENYLFRYMRISQPTLEALVLGVKIARATGDRIAEDSYLQQLRRRFADAPQLRELEAQR